MTGQKLFRFIFSVLIGAGVLAFISGSSLANNLSISNVSLEDRDAGGNTAVVEFDISWQNSWRNDINRDAVWVFLKVCKGTACSPDANVAWTHGMLATAGDNPADSAPGDNADMNIYVTSDLVGAFLYRKSSGNGTMSANDVQLRLDYGASPTSAGDTDQIQVRVFGIEMVYIPEGDFYIGDGNGTSESTSAFHSGTGNAAVQITSALTGDIRVDAGTYDDTQIENTGIGIDGDGGLDTDDNGSVDNANFPTGWTEFYLMKYEMNQAQYRDFLNTLTQEQQNTRTGTDLSAEGASGYYVMHNATTSSFRETIKAGDDPADGMPYTFGCDLNDNEVLDEYDDGEWIAMHYLTWMDLCAYADWAGLRPMTELEFEKAARGSRDEIYGEYSWGTTSATQADSTVVNSGQSNEAASTTGSGLANYSALTILGPLRTGFAATSSTNRTGAGAGYYGVMELSGNIGERTVTVGNTDGRSFEGTHGDGVLTASASYEGNATNTDWPGIDDVQERGVTGASGSGIRGGQWFANEDDMYISYRYNAANPTTRTSEYGGRCARGL
ncbi:MAG: SUMF1/EgtB/PvdO family nonheme iron enzyme [Candidatus Omnitrophota bacterium]